VSYCFAVETASGVQTSAVVLAAIQSLFALRESEARIADAVTTGCRMHERLNLLRAALYFGVGLVDIRLDFRYTPHSFQPSAVFKGTVYSDCVPIRLAAAALAKFLNYKTAGIKVPQYQQLVLGVVLSCVSAWSTVKDVDLNSEAAVEDVICAPAKQREACLVRALEALSNAQTMTGVGTESSLERVFHRLLHVPNLAAELNAFFPDGESFIFIGKPTKEGVCVTTAEGDVPYSVDQLIRMMLHYGGFLESPGTCWGQ
jgi:hypothetical protein